VDNYRIAAGDVSNGSDRFIGEDLLCFLRGQLMANKRADFVSTKLIETNARNQQALGKPGAKHGMFQPGKELRTRQEYRRGYPVITDLRVLVDEG
jgi:hypothetical protein